MLKKILISAVLVLFAAAGVGVLTAAAVRATARARQQKPPIPEPPPVNVRVEAVRAEPEVNDLLELPATVEPNRIVRVSAEVAGRIERIASEEGEAVRAGEPIAYLNAELLQASRDRAAADVDYARKQYDRLFKLSERGAVTVDQRDRAATSMAMAEADLAWEEARLERATILSPIDGVLNGMLVEKGEYVREGTVVAEIVDVETVKVVVQVPEKDVSFFRTGAEAEVQIEMNVPSTILGTITFISELASRQTHATRMEITVVNNPRVLRSGQIVKTRLTRRILKEAIMIPLAAVIPLESGHAVYVVEGEAAQRRTVELGLTRGELVQVTRGLSEGDRLIVAGHRLVGPGQHVKVVANQPGQAAQRTKE